ncbi:MAG TPA: hypothetical protein PKA10_05350 [Selenomonadales bacterium]|nr:hypothetical protein [Selenomonadales bacterium]
MLEARLGIAGTAKNTGKTTTTAAIIRELRARDVAFFLTSIGYDGENIDNVTGLPKPKLRVEPGDIVATAERCLEVSTAVLEILFETGLATPLGKIRVARVKESGLVVTAGPNKSSEVRDLAAMLRRLGPGVTLFDGALNRIAPMVETDGFILATGASRTPDIPRLAKETGLIWELSTLPTVPRSLELMELGIKEVCWLSPELAPIKKWPQSSLWNEEDVGRIWMEPMERYSYLYVPGIIGEKALKAMAEKLAGCRRPFFLTFSDPIKLLVAGEPVVYSQLLRDVEQGGAIVGVGKQVPLLAVTINPFYPEYRMEDKLYKPAFVDERRLQVSLRGKVKVPVFNVVKEGARGLVDIILASGRRWEHPDTMEF